MLLISLSLLYLNDTSDLSFGTTLPMLPWGMQNVALVSYTVDYNCFFIWSILAHVWQMGTIKGMLRLLAFPVSQLS